MIISTNALAGGVDQLKRVQKGGNNSIFIHKEINMHLEEHSLKAVVLTIAHLYGWNSVIWNAKDFYINGVLHVKAMNVANAMVYLLKNENLQATFYDGNHVLVISRII